MRGAMNAYLEAGINLALFVLLTGVGIVFYFAPDMFPQLPEWILNTVRVPLAVSPFSGYRNFAIVSSSQCAR
jgi:hypothetical protein